MKYMMINIHGIQDVATFVKLAVETKADIIASRGSLQVDGCSLVGMMTLTAATKPIEVRYPENAHEFEAYISNFKI